MSILTGEGFRILRKESDLTQHELANMLGLGLATVQRYERERANIPMASQFAMRWVHYNSCMHHVMIKKDGSIVVIDKDDGKFWGLKLGLTWPDARVQFWHEVGDATFPQVSQY